MTRLKYLDPADGQYKLLPVGGGSGGPEEVAIAGTKPGSPYTDLWVDTATPAPVTDWSAADARYNRAGFRNVIRNGDMSIAQRGNGPFTGNGYCLDGWTHSAGPNPSATRIVQAPGLGSPLLRIITSGQSAAGDWATMSQYVEGVSTLQGQMVTYSFNAYAVSGTPKIAVEVEQQFGTGGSPSAVARLSVGAVTISTTMARYSLSFVMPSTAGKTIGTNGNDSCGLMFWLSAGSNNAARASNIGIQNNTFFITDVQLEEGVSATPFERLPVQQQLTWCQRYFQRTGTNNPHNSPNASFNQIMPPGQLNTTSVACTFFFPVVMRSTPVMATGAAGGANIYASSATSPYYPTGWSYNSAGCSANSVVILGTGGSGWPANTMVSIQQNSTNAPAYFDFSAEI